MWLLKKDGSWLAVKETEIAALDRITPESFDNDLYHIAGNGGPIIIGFSGPHDGRGFSFAKRLKAYAPDLRLIAGGKLSPDHARLCFQSGFDEILLTDDLVVRQSASAWQSALEISVDRTYIHKKINSNIPSIWQERASSKEPSLASNS